MERILTKTSEIVESYFKAWKTYDAQLVKEIFSDTASYVILPTKKVLRGTQQIQSYWNRNSRRQENLALYWKTTNATDHFAFTSFTADFYDNEMQRKVRVQGTISFLFEEDKIVCLAEHYEKIVT